MPAPDTPLNDAEEKFAEAAAAFEQAYQIAQKESFKESRQKDVAIYFCRMERAFCLLSIGRKADLDEAIRIYQDMQLIAPSSAVVQYRYAQALMKLKEWDGAILKFSRAQELLQSDRHIPADHWLHDTIPRSMGFVKWSKSLECSENPERKPERLRLLREAYNDTKISYSKSPTRQRKLRAANNGLYYAIEYLGLAGKDHAEEIDGENLERFLAELEEELDIADAPREKLSWLDTMCRAYVHVENLNKAVAVAERIEHLLSADPVKTEDDSKTASVHPEGYYAVTENLNGLERDALDHALWVLRKYGPGPERPVEQRSLG